MASSYQNKIVKQYKDLGYLVIKVIRFSDNGWPDLQCIKDGKTVWIECKEKNDHLKELQKYRIDQLNAAGQTAFCLKKGLGQIYPEKLLYTL